MKNKSGLTLIEVILSIAIVGIMSIAVFTIFNSGMINIFKSRQRTVDVLKIQQDINKAIVESEDGENTTVYVEIPSLGIEKEIQGERITVKKDHINITTFVTIH